jgi:putative solute:sodium symporter small subunit
MLIFLHDFDNSTSLYFYPKSPHSLPLNYYLRRNFPLSKILKKLKSLLNRFLPVWFFFIHAQEMTAQSSPKDSYWSDSLKLVGKLLSIWFLVSFGCGILFKDYLDQFSIGGAPLGFWMAQQGSIFCFVIILIAYSFLMNKLDEKHGFGEEEN